ncbi:MAG: hypothetical protein OCD01_07540 [Fibrobacterales bacterium]
MSVPQKRIAILMTYATREKEYSERIQGYLEQSGCVVILATILDEDLPLKLVKFNPSTILMSPVFVPHCAQIAYFIKFVTECHIVTIPPEGLILWQNGNTEQLQRAFIRVTKHDTSLVSFAFHWGAVQKGYADQILIREKLLRSQDQIIAVGNPLFEKWVHLSKKSEKVKGMRDNIICVSAFAYAENSIKHIFSYSDVINAETAENDFYTFFRVLKNHRSQVKQFKKMVKEIAIENPEKLVTIKLHPVEYSRCPMLFEEFKELEKEYDNIIIANKDVTMDQLLPTAAVLVHYGSTSAIEAKIMNVPAVLVEEIATPVEAFFRSDYSVSIKDVASKIKENLRVKPYSQEQREFLQSYFGLDVGQLEEYKPCRRVADELIRIDNERSTILDTETDFFKEYMPANKIEQLLNIVEKLVVEGVSSEAIGLIDKCITFLSIYNSASNTVLTNQIIAMRQKILTMRQPPRYQ